VGIAVGDTDGAEVVGETEGDWVGPEAVGETEGDWVGSEAVGDVEGDKVGSEVVGETEGGIDGAAVGGADGALVAGAAVGAAVEPCATAQVNPPVPASPPPTAIAAGQPSASGTNWCEHNVAIASAPTPWPPQPPKQCMVQAPPSRTTAHAWSTVLTIVSMDAVVLSSAASRDWNPDHVTTPVPCLQRTPPPSSDTVQVYR